MTACCMHLACGPAQAGIGASLSHTPARGRYNRVDPGGHELGPGRPASQHLAMLFVVPVLVPFLGGDAACWAARKRRSRL
jgi:hypothetical protein